MKMREATKLASQLGQATLTACLPRLKLVKEGVLRNVKDFNSTIFASDSHLFVYLHSRENVAGLDEVQLAGSHYHAVLKRG